MLVVLADLNISIVMRVRIVVTDERPLPAVDTFAISSSSSTGLLCLLPRNGSHWRLHPDHEFLLRTEIDQTPGRAIDLGGDEIVDWRQPSTIYQQMLSPGTGESPSARGHRQQQWTTEKSIVEIKSEEGDDQRCGRCLKVELICTSKACTLYSSQFAFRVFQLRWLGNQLKMSKLTRDADDMFYITQRSTHLIQIRQICSVKHLASSSQSLIAPFLPKMDQGQLVVLLLLARIPFLYCDQYRLLSSL